MQTCKAPNCDRLVVSRGYCGKHYQQIRKHGRLTPEKEHRRIKNCMADGCNNKVYTHGYCKKHYIYMNSKGYISPKFTRTHLKNNIPARKIDAKALRILVWEYGFTLQELGDIVGVTKEYIRQKIESGIGNANWIENSLIEDEKNIILDMADKLINKYKVNDTYIRIGGNDKDICILIKNGDNIKVLFDIPSEIKKILLNKYYHIRDDLEREIYNNIQIVTVDNKKYGILPEPLAKKFYNRRYHYKNYISNFAKKLGVYGFKTTQSKSNKALNRYKEILEKYKVDPASNVVYIPINNNDYILLYKYAARRDMTIDELIEQLGYKRMKKYPKEK